MTDLTLCIGCTTSRGERLCPVCEMQLVLSDSPIAVPSKAAVSADGVSSFPRRLAPSADLSFEDDVAALERAWGLMPRYVNLPLSNPSPLTSRLQTATAESASFASDAAFSFGPRIVRESDMKTIVSRTFAVNETASMFSIDPADISSSPSVGA